MHSTQTGELPDFERPLVHIDEPRYCTPNASRAVNSNVHATLQSLFRYFVRLCLLSGRATLI